MSQDTSSRRRPGSQADQAPSPSPGEAPVSAGATATFRDPRVILPFLLITLIWGSTWIVIKDQLGTVPAVWSVSYRFYVAGAAMLAIALLRGEGLRIGRGGFVLAAMLGTFQFVVNYNFVYAAELYITSGLAAVVFALLVVPNTILAWLFFGQRVTGRFALGSAVAMAGVALLFVQELANSHAPGMAGACGASSICQLRHATISADGVLTGLALVMVAVLAASISNVMQIMPAIKARPVAPLLGWAMLYGATANAVFGWAYVGPPAVEPRLGYWIGIVYLGLIASALAFWLYFDLIRKIGPARAAYSSVLIPMIAMVISTFAEGYRWSALALAGGALAMAGLVIALRSSRAPPQPPAD